MDMKKPSRPIEILLVEDNAADAQLVERAFRFSRTPVRLYVVEDGVQALDYLRRTAGYTDSVRPDLIMLDLNLPGRDGHQVLKELKNDPDLKEVPVVIYSGSAMQRDVKLAYRLGGNCYIRKPVDLEEFFGVVASIERFWLNTALLPSL
uniref:Response regulator receiver protein n=1 Tax=Solibacter usitatus (strain Ellin6076) TaxID=234267 RepID=Q028L3_SOLUE